MADSSTSTGAARPKRYETVAADIVRSIDAGTLRAGDRLPSVRQASTARRVSVSTIFQAYYLLEARGYIQARDRSGYYVSPRKPAPPEPELHAAIIASHSATSRPIGFSRKTCLPAAAAAWTNPRCVVCGVAMTTPSTSGRASSAGEAAKAERDLYGEP